MSIPIDVFEYGNVLRVHKNYILVEARHSGEDHWYSFFLDMLGMTDYYSLELLQEACSKGFEFVEREEERFIFRKIDA